MALEGEYAPSIHEWARVQAEQFESSAGAEAGELKGKPIIVMTNVGAKSGKLHKTALMRVEHEGSYAVVASRGGAPTHPQWYWNLLAHPEVELQDVAERHTYLAREVHGAERDTWWARAVEAWPDYAEYQKKTERMIPVFVLERA